MSFTVLQANTDINTAATDATWVIGAVPGTFSTGNYTPVKLSITSPSLVTGASATQNTLTFKRYRGAVDQGTFATFVTSTGNDLPALTEVVIPVTAGTTFNAGDVVTVAKTHTSTGTALPAGLLFKVEIQ